MGKKAARGTNKGEPAKISNTRFLLMCKKWGGGPELHKN
jgi:hypothetical protein